MEKGWEGGGCAGGVRGTAAGATGKQWEEGGPRRAWKAEGASLHLRRRGRAGAGGSSVSVVRGKTGAGLLVGWRAGFLYAERARALLRGDPRRPPAGG